MRRISPGIMVILAIGIYITSLSAACHIKFHFFGYGDFDLAHHAQSVRNILRGSTDCSILGIPFLGNHMALILYAFAPLYAVFPSPLILLYLQTLSLACGAWGIYLLGKKELSERWAAGIAILYLAYPPLIYLNLYEFHPVALAVPFLIWTTLTYKRRQFSAFIILLFLSMLCQENISLVAIAWGAYAAIEKAPQRYIWTPAIVGAIYFVLMIFIVMPRLNNNMIQFTRLYGHLGNSLTDVFSTILLHPIRTCSFALSSAKLIFLNALLAPVAYTSILAPTGLMPALFVGAQRMLSQRASESTILFHYQAEFIPFIFLSCIYGIRKARNSQHRIVAPALLTTLIIFPIAAIISMGSMTTVMNTLSPQSYDPTMRKFGNSFLRQIPPDARVMATFNFLPKLANHKELYSLHHVYDGYYTLSDIRYPVPEVDYILIDTMDHLTFSTHGFYGPTQYTNLLAAIEESKWRVISQRESILLLGANTGVSVSLLTEECALPLNLNTNVNQSCTTNIQLLGFTTHTQLSDGALPITLFWRKIKNCHNDYLIDLELASGLTSYKTRLAPGSRLHPPQSWAVGTIIADRQTLAPDNIKATNDTLSLNINLVLVEAK
ncbi:MAG: DUF2079 domain-containing protein [Lentisphaerae bacterium]|nr:DUF2079 domain-containing protein [Lentisphaerota bacterium]